MDRGAPRPERCPATPPWAWATALALAPAALAWLVAAAPPTDRFTAALHSPAQVARTDAATPIARPPRDLLLLSHRPAPLQRMQRHGLTVSSVRTLPALGFSLHRVRAPVDRDLAELRHALPGVIVAENAPIRPAARPSGWDGRGVVGWPGVDRRCGLGQRIGMIDTRVDTAHPAFRFKSITRRSFLPEEHDAAVSHHGTAVASLLVGNSEAGFGGLLQGATLLAADIFEHEEDGAVAGDLFAMLGALEWLVQQRVQIINMSLEMGENVVLSAALDAAANVGIVLTAPAGNGGAGARPAYPAAHPAVLSTTAVDPGLRIYRFANRGSYIDFAAPGVHVWTAGPDGGQPISGTSFAVPFLSAVAAVHLARGLPPEPDGLRQAIVRDARDLGRPGKDDVYGWGLVRIEQGCG